MKKPRSYITAILTQEGKFIVAEDAATRVTTQGMTMEEAVKNLREAVSLYLEETDSGNKLSLPPQVTLATVEL